MGIFRAIGLGLVIIIVKVLVPEIFHAGESLLITFFSTLQGHIEHPQSLTAGGAYLFPH